MIVELTLPDRTRHKVRVVQVVQYDDSGNPIGLAYQAGALTVSHDVMHPDFRQACDRLKVKPIDP